MAKAGSWNWPDPGAGTSGQQWTIDGYTLLFASLLLFAGNLADRAGAKKALGLGIIVFTVASAACAAATSIGVLIAARCLQGAGAAVLLLITALISLRVRTKPATAEVGRSARD